MAAYTAETRRKEIGIRKMLGSSVWQWLQEFASRISITSRLLLGNILVLTAISLQNENLGTRLHPTRRMTDVYRIFVHIISRKFFGI